MSVVPRRTIRGTVPPMSTAGPLKAASTSGWGGSRAGGVRAIGQIGGRVARPASCTPRKPAVVASGSAGRAGR